MKHVFWVLLCSSLIFNSSFSLRAQISLNIDKVGINVDTPSVALDIYDIGNVTELKVRNNNLSRISIDGASPNLDWRVHGVRKAFASWSSNQLKLYSSPAFPPFNFTYPTMSFTEDRKVGINMGLSGTPTEALDVNGRIKVGNSSETPSAGTMRWNATEEDFEGFDGAEWLSLTASQGPAINPNGVGRITEIQHVSSLNTNGGIFGYDVYIDGTQAAVGSSRFTKKGAIHFFEKSGNEWQEIQALTPVDIDSSSFFGIDVAIDGGWAAVTAVWHTEDSIRQGAVYVYRKTGSTWVQHQKLTLPNPREDDRFGSSIDIDGGKLVAGAFLRRNSSGIRTGSVATYLNINGTWTYITEYFPANGADEDLFGIAVAINDNQLVVGASNDDSDGVNRGAVFVYGQDGLVYGFPQEIYPGSYASVSGQGYANFGQAVAISGKYVATSRKTGGQQLLLWQEDENKDHQEFISIPHNGFFDLLEDEFRDVHMDGDHLIASFAGYDGGADCNNIIDNIGKVVIMKRQENTWFKCDEYLDPSGTPGDGNSVRVSISADGHFAISYLGAEYGSKVVFGKVE